MPRTGGARKRRPCEVLMGRGRSGFAPEALLGGGKAVLEVQPLAHFLARLEIGHALGGDVDRVAGPRITALARIALAGGESAETAKLDPAALVELVDDRIEESGDDAFD